MSTKAGAFDVPDVDYGEPDYSDPVEQAGTAAKRAVSLSHALIDRFQGDPSNDGFYEEPASYLVSACLLAASLGGFPPSYGRTLLLDRSRAAVSGVLEEHNLGVFVHGLDSLNVEEPIYATAMRIVAYLRADEGWAVEGDMT